MESRALPRRAFLLGLWWLAVVVLLYQRQAAHRQADVTPPSSAAVVRRTRPTTPPDVVAEAPAPVVATPETPAPPLVVRPVDVAPRATAPRRAVVTHQPAQVTDLERANAALSAGRTQDGRAILDAVATRRLSIDERARLGALQEWAGDLAGAQASQQTVLAARPTDRTALEAVARLAQWRGDDATTDDALTRLAALRPLTADEQLRLAAAARHAGDEDRARALYRTVRAEALASHDELALARADAALGDAAGTTTAYTAYLEAHPDDVDARLEAARVFVNAGEPARAVAAYQSVIAARGDTGLALDMARTLLAAQRYADAEPWARLALEDGDDPREARLALAQSILLQGRRADAVPLFRAAAAEAPGNDAWQARVALAENRHLAAERLAMAADPMSPDLALVAGDAAARRGDFARAYDAYTDAIARGAMLQGGVAESKLAQQLLPFGYVRPVFFEDANRIRLSEGVLGGAFWPVPAVRLTAQGLAGVVQQRDVQYTRTGASIGADNLYPLPDLELAARAGFENYAGGGGNIVTGSVLARKHFDDTSALSLIGTRESLLSPHDEGEPRAWNRIIDLKRLGPAFAVTGGRVALDKFLREAAGDRLFVELGAQNYEDGNLRGTFYGHYQLPLDERPGSWTVLRPNAYFEAFKHPDQPAYFSPKTHASVGTMLHTIQEHGRWRVEAEANPQMIVSDGDVGPGVHALLDVSVQVGRARVGVAGFVFYDGNDDYWLARAMARVVVPFD